MVIYVHLNESLWNRQYRYRVHTIDCTKFNVRNCLKHYSRILINLFVSYFRSISNSLFFFLVLLLSQYHEINILRWETWWGQETFIFDHFIKKMKKSHHGKSFINLISHISFSSNEINDGYFLKLNNVRFGSVFIRQLYWQDAFVGGCHCILHVEKRRKCNV